MPASTTTTRLRTKPRSPWFLFMLTLTVTFSSVGCMNEMIMLAYLIGGPPSIEPDFDRVTTQSMTEKDVRVAVVVYAPDDVLFSFHHIDVELAKHVAFKLREHQITVYNPDVVRNWLDRHDDWDKPEEIGEALGATFVIFVDLSKFSLWEENSPNLYRGRGEALVSVIEMDEESEDGEKIYRKEVISVYPLTVPRAASEVTYSQFKLEYLNRLSEDIGRLFYEHYNGDDIVDAI